jgi:hypothetical protein
MVVYIKKLLVVLAVLVLIMGGGYVYINNYLFNPVSELDKATTEKQQEIILSNDQYIELPEVKELKQQLEAKHAGKGVNWPQTADSDSVLTKAEIESQLQQKLNNLQGEYNGKINGLLSSARSEYVQVKSGSKSGSVGSLAKKYMNMGKALEAECDARVYAAIAYAENELAQYNYKSNIPEQARKTYKQSKDERRVQLFDKLASYL